MSETEGLAMDIFAACFQGDWETAPEKDKELCRRFADWHSNRMVDAASEAHKS